MAVEIRKARVKSLKAAIAAIEGETSDEAQRLRDEFEATIAAAMEAYHNGDAAPVPPSAVRRRAIEAARRRANELRLSGAIGDEAFRTLENEFDWDQLAAGQEA
ncbi:MAG: hypothetical protein QM702_11210 [Rubrivivax sp.]